MGPTSPAASLAAPSAASPATTAAAAAAATTPTVDVDVDVGSSPRSSVLAKVTTAKADADEEVVVGGRCCAWRVAEGGSGDVEAAPRKCSRLRGGGARRRAQGLARPATGRSFAPPPRAELGCSALVSPGLTPAPTMVPMVPPQRLLLPPPTRSGITAALRECERERPAGPLALRPKGGDARCGARCGGGGVGDSSGGG